MKYSFSELLTSHLQIRTKQDENRRKARFAKFKTRKQSDRFICSFSWTKLEHICKRTFRFGKASVSDASLAGDKFIRYKLEAKRYNNILCIKINFKTF